MTAAADSLGMCIFGRSITDAHLELITNAINDAHGTSLDIQFYEKIGRETLGYEHQFNLDAGFTSNDDELPSFFYDEPLAPSNKVARFHNTEVSSSMEKLRAN
jgi:aldehyde:ferredoxin oxidoreductase